MGTPHNEANVGDIAKVVLMPGDPLRAKVIAEKYLENPRLVNQVRGMYAYTGTYKGKEITVMGHGMGMPSAGIYFYELFNFYGVEKIIRIGSCGVYDPNLELFDTILVNGSYTESEYAYTLNNVHDYFASPTKELTDHIEEVAKQNGIKLIRGNAVSSDCFNAYMTDDNKFTERLPKEKNIIVCEMESFALFYIANLLNKESACLLTVVDSKFKTEEVSPEQRQNSMDNMVKVALESII